jgi:hypothetical protein
VRSKSTELEKLMLLQPPCETGVVEVVEAVNRIPKCFIILFFDKQVIVCVIHGLNIELKSNQDAYYLMSRELTCCTAIRYERMSGIWSTWRNMRTTRE